MSKEIRYWIQKADLTVREFPPADALDAVAAFQQHDWQAELAMRAELEESGGELCDPGLGFVDSGPRILHICPLDGTDVYFHYHFQQSRKVLWLFPVTVQMTSSNMRMNSQRMPEVIQNFFSENHEWLLEHSNVPGT